MKIQFLKASLLFNEWPMDELVKLAYAMRKKLYSKGSVILSQGDRVDSIAIVKKGTVKIIHKMTKQRKTKMLHSEGRKDSLLPNKITSESVEIAIDIAETGPHDLVGIVEAMTNSKKMRNEALAQNQVEIFFIQNNMFTSFLKQERKTSTHLEKLGKRGVCDETLLSSLDSISLNQREFIQSGKTNQVGGIEKRLCFTVCVYNASVVTKESCKDVSLLAIKGFNLIR